LGWGGFPAPPVRAVPWGATTCCDFPVPSAPTHCGIPCVTLILRKCWRSFFPDPLQFVPPASSYLFLLFPQSRTRGKPPGRVSKDRSRSDPPLGPFSPRCGISLGLHAPTRFPHSCEALWTARLLFFQLPPLFLSSSLFFGRLALDFSGPLLVVRFFSIFSLLTPLARPKPRDLRFARVIHDFPTRLLRLWCRHGVGTLPFTVHFFFSGWNGIQIFCAITLSWPVLRIRPYCVWGALLFLGFPASSFPPSP